MSRCDEIEKQQQKKARRKRSLNKASLFAINTSENKQEFNKNWEAITKNFDLLYSTPENVNDLKQTILQLAVQGKLTEKWRTLRQAQGTPMEPASVLLEKIRKEKERLMKKGKIKKQKPLPEITEEEEPFELPEGWEWCRMGEIAEYQKGYAFKSANYLDRGLMITKIRNLTDNHTKNSVYIDPKRATEFGQYLLRVNDIVMTTVGSWFSAPVSAVGRSFLVNKIFDHSLLNQNAVRIRFSKDLEPMYLFACINSPAFKGYLVQEAQGTANQASITQGA